jgi:hypothetical protein
MRQLCMVLSQDRQNDCLGVGKTLRVVHLQGHPRLRPKPLKKRSALIGRGDSIPRLTVRWSARPQPIGRAVYVWQLQQLVKVEAASGPQPGPEIVERIACARVEIHIDVCPSERSGGRLLTQELGKRGADQAGVQRDARVHGRRRP